jgi:hypothetical protein
MEKCKRINNLITNDSITNDSMTNEQ